MGPTIKQNCIQAYQLLIPNPHEHAHSNGSQVLFMYLCALLVASSILCSLCTWLYCEILPAVLFFLHIKQHVNESMKDICMSELYGPQIDCLLIYTAHVRNMYSSLLYDCLLSCFCALYLNISHIMMFDD